MLADILGMPIVVDFESMASLWLREKVKYRKCMLCCCHVDFMENKK
jgi:hypothetical protein